MVWRSVSRLGRAVGRSLLALLKLLLLLVILVLPITLYGYHWFDREVLSTLPTDLSQLQDYRPLTACQVYDASGDQIDDFYVERRVWVPLDELPPVVWQAFLSAEDRRFLKHKGVDYLGIARAAWINVLAGDTSQGGSTLTQQLVKNLLVGRERTYTRKLKEAVLAGRLERELDKWQILELYLNYVALGSGNYGVESAAQDYFGLSARDIDAGQAALLAGLVPAPSRYSPRANPALARERRRIVLSLMVDEGFVTAAEAERFAEQPVALPTRGHAGDTVGLAYRTGVRREVRRLFGTELPFEVGLHVYTPYDEAVQSVAEKAVRDAADAVEARQGWPGPSRHLEPADWKAFLDAGEGLSPGEDGAFAAVTGTCLPALVGRKRDLADLQAGPLHLSLRQGDRASLVRTDDPEKPALPLSRAVNPGDVLRVCIDDDGSVRRETHPWVEASTIVLENATGRVIAVVGGRRVELEGFVRALQGLRQPGSSFKPYVYASALLAGHSQLDSVVDGPIALPAGGGKMWSPKNYGGSYAGRVTLRQAIAKSLNTVAVRLGLKVGIGEVVRVAGAMGVRTRLKRDPTVALGSSEVTPLDQALGYATIARMGVRAEPVWIDRLLDVDGRQVARAGQEVKVRGGTYGRLPGGPGERVLPAGVAAELADMMRGVVEAGTARKARVPGQDRAGKTGTTNDFVDAWFVGFTPTHTVAVWVGTDGTHTLGGGETGGRAALPAWMAIVDALPPTDGQRFTLPDDAVLVQSGGQWVTLARGHVPSSVLPLPRVGEAPLPLFSR